MASQTSFRCTPDRLVGALINNHLQKHLKTWEQFGNIIHCLRKFLAYERGHESMPGIVHTKQWLSFVYAKEPAKHKTLIFWLFPHFGCYFLLKAYPA